MEKVCACNNLFKGNNAQTSNSKVNRGREHPIFAKNLILGV
ncbi:hypothetical protein CWATWH0402_298 [Crocosphaera watsonii WH 0402]|uniref:Uncharacterized protein n=1 Tax=Crocosphaera watsonii WH 0402 TaxID=1284629 RepID=T2JV41_CROWT|nr:hypothetical protein CWATWH0402_298 [Crocosphaera watsonii WH 0402]